MTDRGEPTPSHEYFLDLARTLPKIPIDDPRVQMILDARKRGDTKAENIITNNMALWMNNFYAVFLVMRIRRLNPENPEAGGLLKNYLDRGEKLGESWEVFTANNQDLIGELDKEIGKFQPVSDLMSYPMSLFTTRSGLTPHQAAERFESLESAAEHPLGIAAIYYAATDRLNPLLKRAWTAMETAGIDPNIFVSGSRDSQNSTTQP